jgi:hypothetical protein
MKEIFALVSAILILAAAPPYVINTLRGKTRPERVTWLIFSVLGLIAFISQLGLGASWSLVFSGLDTAASILVLSLSIKHGVGGHTKLDTIALVVAAIGVVIAIIAKAPVISLLGVILADLSGMGLTIKKTYLKPESETTVSWLLVGTASLFGLLSVGRFSYGILLYPFYLMLANYSVPVTQLLGRILHNNKNNSSKHK